MPITRMHFGNSPFLGVLGVCTEEFTLLPRLELKEELVALSLGTKVVRADVLGSPLLGIFLAGNSNGLVAPYLLGEEEERVLVEAGLRIFRLESKLTALGNLLLVNDYGGIASPEFTRKELAQLEKALGVRIEKGRVAGEPTVGSLAVATNKGVLAHPNLSEKEARQIERVLQVPVSIGTACGGVGYVGLCMLGNSKGVVVGEPTTGAELGRIESALGFV
ncbi:MAG: translation initiation factor IF-6 [Candidatus Hadarchaeales archaeon]